MSARSGWNDGIQYGYGVIWRIAAESPLVMGSAFFTFHEAATRFSGSVSAAVHTIAEGEWLEPPVAVCVNGEWYVEEGSPMADLFIEGEYMEESGRSSVMEDLIGDDPVPSGTGNSAPKSGAKSGGKKTMAVTKKPVAKAAVKKASPKATPKAAPAKSGPMPTGRSKLEGTDKIKLTGEQRKYRDGTRDGDTFKLIKDGMTVQQIQNAYAKTKHAKDKPSVVPFLAFLKRAGYAKFIGTNGKAK